MHQRSALRTHQPAMGEYLLYAVSCVYVYTIMIVCTLLPFLICPDRETHRKGR